MKKYLPLALFLGFLFISIVTFINSKPSSKNARVYKIVKEYSPYYFQKSFGGLKILSKEDKNFKEEPENTKLFKRFEELERNWGKKHLKIKDNKLEIYDNSNKLLKTVELKTKDEVDFVHRYYGVK
jgi:hypothetical protein